MVDYKMVLTKIHTYSKMQENKMVAVFVLVMTLGLLVTTSSAIQIEAVTCEKILYDLVPCDAYLTGLGDIQPSRQCCEEARQMSLLFGDTTEDHRKVCECSRLLAGLDPERARLLCPL